MKIRSIVILGCVLLILNFKLGAQEILISETDSIAIFDTYISLNSSENVSPVIYNDGLIYASANKSNYYQLYYSDLKSKSKKIKTGSNYKSGLVAVYKNEIYFTDILQNSISDSSINLAINKGKIENFKVSKARTLPICKEGLMPLISSEVSTSCPRPSRAKYSHWMGMISSSAAVRALIVSNPRDGGQSIST